MENGVQPILRIVRTPGTCSGKPRIAGRRIRVQDVAIWYERLEMTPGEMVVQYPGLTLADIHAALSYYYDHREEILNDIREADRLVEEMMSLYPSILQEKRSDQHADSLPPG